MTCFLIEVKFHIETSQVEGNVYGHMTKMAATPIKGKKSLKIFSGTKKANGFGTLYAAFGMWALQSLHK